MPGATLRRSSSASTILAARCFGARRSTRARRPWIWPRCSATRDRGAGSTYYTGGARATEEVALGPKAHAEIPLAAEHEGRRIERVELKAPFRLASYVVGRREPDGELVLFDHLFTYFK